MTITYTKGCMTKFLGPTDHKRSRVKATHLATGNSIVRECDDALSIDGNHDSVAQALLGSPNLLRTAVDGGGFVYMVKP